MKKAVFNPWYPMWGWILLLHSRLCGEFGLNCFILTQMVPVVKSQVTQISAECRSCNCTPPLFGKEIIEMAAPIL